MADRTEPRRIRVLREDVARRIAAGEVIDRPLSVVRELLDNAIDSGAANVTVSVEAGGIGRIRIVDDGCGMLAEDLRLCVEPHATSKIEDVEDIYRVTTLGFRGEALSSIAACAKLEITSALHGHASQASRIVVHSNRLLSFEPCAGTPGTSVDVSDLFYALPGRRKFLKSVGAETAQCRAAFVEKALPFPAISFRLVVDGEMKLFLPAAALTGRVAAALAEQLRGAPLHEVRRTVGAVTVHAAASDPGYSRGDRRLISLYLNSRRIQEYALVQAVQYTYDRFLPGGRFPAAIVFITVDPASVDFNVHPAKREVRFRNLPEVHRAVVETLGGLLSRWSASAPSLSAPGWEPAEPASPYSTPASGALSFDQPPPSDRARLHPSAIDLLRARAERTGGRPPAAAEPSKPRYVGQAFGLFIIVERRDRMYVIDQHAAHERILFDRLRAEGLRVQRLLVPETVTLEPEEEKAMMGHAEEYRRLGIRMERESPGVWRITACPEQCIGRMESLRDALRRGEGEIGVEKELYAAVACAAAIKDGDAVDAVTAVELAAQALTLDPPRCPHGRPLWFEIDRARLLELVGRT